MTLSTEQLKRMSKAPTSFPAWALREAVDELLLLRRGVEVSQVGWPEPDDLDPDEKCPACGMQLWQDNEGDWNHVIFDEEGHPLAFTMICEPEQEAK